MDIPSVIVLGFFVLCAIIGLSPKSEKKSKEKHYEDKTWAQLEMERKQAADDMINSGGWR